MPAISGFMIVKNVIRQGYPFAEAIASSLPVCDEFLISDGYSDDGTFEMLQKIASLNKKVKLSRTEWEKKDLTVLADVSNKLREQCSSDYLFYVQAAEVVHEDNVKMLRAIPDLFPETETFSLPFVSAVANLKIEEEFRLRACKNLDRLNLTGDAWAFSVSKKFIRSEALHSLRRPKKLLRYVGRGIEWTFASSFNTLRSKAVYLPKPIFRYPALFKANYIERCKGHIEYLNVPGYRDVIRSIEQEEGEAFFEKVRQLLSGSLGVHYCGDFGVLKTEDHPRIIQEFITKRMTVPRYYVRDSVLDTIAKA